MTERNWALPLQGLRVVELTGMDSVAYAGMLLAQLGAEVIKVEPPGGDPLRARAPFASGDAPISLPFEFLNGGKQSVAVDLSGEAGTEHLDALLRAADVVLQDSAAVEALGVPLPPRTEGQLRVNVGYVGGSPEEHVPTSSLTRLHGSGLGYIIPADIDMSVRPGWTGPYAFETMFGVGVALAVVAERARPGGAEVDFSLQAYGAWLDKLLFSRTSARGIDFHRDTSVYPYGGNLPCADGFVSLFVIEEHQWRGFCSMIGRPEWVADERFANGVLRSKNRAPIIAALDAWCLEHTVEEILAAAKKADVPTGRVRSPREVLSSDVLRDREFFAIRKTAAGEVEVPTLPFGKEFRGAADAASPSLPS